MYPSTFAAPAYLPFLLLLFAVVGLWIHRYVWIGALVASVVTAYVSGGLYGYAFLWLALLAAAAWSYRLRIVHPGLGPPPWVYLLAFCAVALWLGLVTPQGFPRVPFVDSVMLSPDATVWSMGLGFTKVVQGIFVIGLLHPDRVSSWRELWMVLKRVTPVFLVTTAGVMLVAMALGSVRFEPKWSPLFLVWAPVNLLFTCMAEEAFFRGLVQRELSALGSNRKLAAIIGIAVGALMYGLVHYRGGWKAMLVQILAGAGFGWAYYRTRRIEAAMGVHFGVDCVHFLLFTFPALADSA